ncbi:MAG: dual specificity protein phosphatase family protein [Pegethrix bostrychoides GSE-TBD4-15B]|uniref:Dual specificity protein phosphatase family protein n=1 Tax=Pegethrix bostrychoides GSE-TBD4-15B TaxID=2839662 RepID=A0A951P9Z1_9CYAN|nr:dual specificity protein phosphatase family protein [Pegethrix bostrychoides GSE-TBD4-15B]
MEDQTVQPISDSLWWVIPQKLAGVRKPNSDELIELLTLGIGAIVSVMDDPSNLDLYKIAKLPYLWLPTQGGTAPSPEQVQELVAFVDQQNKLATAVAIHCTSGRRRTGTMLAAYLISRGASVDAALQTILTANPQVELREAQINFLKDLASAR